MSFKGENLPWMQQDSAYIFNAESKLLLGPAKMSLPRSFRCRQILFCHTENRMSWGFPFCHEKRGILLKSLILYCLLCLLTSNGTHPILSLIPIFLTFFYCLSASWGSDCILQGSCHCTRPYFNVILCAILIASAGFPRIPRLVFNSLSKKWNLGGTVIHP